MADIKQVGEVQGDALAHAVMFGVDKKTIHNVYHRNYKSEI